MVKNSKDKENNYSQIIEPMGNYLVVQPLETERKTTLGLSLPDNSELETPNQGKVVAVGKKAAVPYRDKGIGLTILFPKHAGVEVTIEDKLFRVIHKDDILAVLHFKSDKSNINRNKTNQTMA